MVYGGVAPLGSSGNSPPEATELAATADQQFQIPKASHCQSGTKEPQSNPAAPDCASPAQREPGPCAVYRNSTQNPVRRHTSAGQWAPAEPGLRSHTGFQPPTLSASATRHVVLGRIAPASGSIERSRQERWCMIQATRMPWQAPLIVQRFRIDHRFESLAAMQKRGERSFGDSAP